MLLELLESEVLLFGIIGNGRGGKHAGIFSWTPLEDLEEKLRFVMCVERLEIYPSLYPDSDSERN
jgi:hypothetical protein